MNNEYKILRPPLAENFELPSRDELLGLKKGSLVKLIFAVEKLRPERMWVILNDISNPELWTGILDNDAVDPEIRKILPAGKQINFHPLDVIAISV